jgi:hypothetical protein
MKHRDDSTLPSLVYITLVCNTVSSVCLKNCILGCTICLFIILLLAGNQSMHETLNLNILP